MYCLHKLCKVLRFFRLFALYVTHSISDHAQILYHTCGIRRLHRGCKPQSHKAARIALFVVALEPHTIQAIRINLITIQAELSE